MKQVVAAGSSVRVEEVPPPGNSAGRVLVEVVSSAISAGTELAGIGEASLPLWRKALRNPDKVKSALARVRNQGLGAAKAMVSNAGAPLKPIGYSAAGIVAGDGTGEYEIGDLVACAGAQCAHHAEVISVPGNLVVRVPSEVTPREASTVALGAIALQGVRRATPSLGESFVVIGLGIIGQLAAQLLRVNGCRVLGADSDPSRTEVARQLGTTLTLDSVMGVDEDSVRRLTGGVGADGVLVAASSASDEIMSQAFQMCRKKGRVVLIGDVGLNLKRADFYAKELDFFISSSYGPGRYDRRYEEEGLDYPIGFVRWTENRNMSEYLRTVAEKKIDLTPLLSADYEVERAPEAYASFTGSAPRPLIVTISYPHSNGSSEARSVRNRAAKPLRKGAVGIAVIGAGGFANSVHMPNIASSPAMFSLVAVATRQGHTAAAAARRFGAQYSTTDVDQVLGDKDVDAVLIATRHDLHADLVLKALEADKHVLVEKPLATQRRDLERIRDFYESADADAPVLMTGFNRRFSRLAIILKEQLEAKQGPVMLSYRMNAGYQPPDRWVHGPEGGGRNIGEACHIYDLFGYLLDAEVASVSAETLRPNNDHYRSDDNFVATISFAEGSLASLTYTALGTSELPKERLEVFWDGRAAVLDDYAALRVVGGLSGDVTSRVADKGHFEELRRFGQCVLLGEEWPIPLWQQLQATEISFDVDVAIGARPHGPEQ